MPEIPTQETGSNRAPSELEESLEQAYQEMRRGTSEHSSGENAARVYPWESPFTYNFSNYRITPTQGEPDAAAPRPASGPAQGIHFTAAITIEPSGEGSAAQEFASCGPEVTLEFPAGVILPTAAPRKSGRRKRNCASCGTEAPCRYVSYDRQGRSYGLCGSCQATHAVHCADCGKLSSKDSCQLRKIQTGANTTEERRVCGSCLRERYRSCSCCSRTSPLALSAFAHVDNQFYCAFCLGEFGSCGSCSKPSRKALLQGYTLRTPDGLLARTFCCSACRRQLCGCGKCDAYALQRDLLPHPRKPKADKVCSACAVSLAPKPTTPTFSARTFRHTLHYRNAFGIELECYAPAGKLLNFPEFTAGTDGSITPAPGTVGVEYRSRILQGDSGVNALRRFLRAAAAAHHGVNASCGLHVHIDLQGYSNEEILRIAAIVHLFDSVLFALQHHSRWVNRYCRGFHYPQLEISQQGLEFFAHASRYRGANFAAFFEHGTLEFRYHAGELAFRPIYYWLRLCLAVVNRAAALEGEIAYSKRLAAAPDALQQFLAMLQLPAHDCAFWTARLAANNITGTPEGTLLEVYA